MPEMVFEYILKKNGIDPQKDLTIDQSVDFGSTAAAFTSDDSAAYTVEFEPSATILAKRRSGLCSCISRRGIRLCTIYILQCKSKLHERKS